MPTVKVPIVNGQYSNIDGAALSDDAYQLWDTYVDERGANNRRPALTTKLDLSQPTYGGIRGMLYVPQTDKLYVVWQNAFSIITRSGTTLSLSTTLTTAGSGSVVFNVTMPRVKLIYDGTNVYFPADGHIIYYDPATGTLKFLDQTDAQAPTAATHIDTVDGYLLGNGSGNSFYFSEAANFLGWSALDFASATGSPDFIKALHVFQREVYLFGTDTTEIWEDDGVSPFIRTPGGLLETGISAPYSVVKNDSGVHFLSNKRRIVRFDGRNLSVISSPFDKDIQAFDAVATATSDRVNIGGREFLLFHFPEENTTLAWNVDQDHWAKWGKYDGGAGSYDRFNAQCFVDIPDWNMRLMGSLTDAKLYTLDADVYDDDDSEIRSARVTGHINYGTTKTKRSNELRITARRGDTATSATTDAKLMLRWNDNNRGWGNWHELSLGASGVRDIVLRLQRTGVFRTRQYELACTDSVPMVYLDAEEDIEVLR